MASVSILDYGLGNLKAFWQIYQDLNIEVEIASTPEQLRRAQRIILPGVGSFDWAMQKLNSSGLRDVLDNRVLVEKIPVLGVCVGMQMMAVSSEEGKCAGLGWVDANVAHLGKIEMIPLPHMGWNSVCPTNQDSLFRNIQNHRYYFLHSFHLVPADKTIVLSTTNYERIFVSAIRSGSIFGTQFHPEKSHKSGSDLLRNFVGCSARC